MMMRSLSTLKQVSQRRSSLLRGFNQSLGSQWDGLSEFRIHLLKDLC